jgi:hypothetical protein
VPKTIIEGWDPAYDMSEITWGRKAVLDKHSLDANLQERVATPLTKDPPVLWSH